MEHENSEDVESKLGSTKEIKKDEIYMKKTEDGVEINIRESNVPSPPTLLSSITSSSSMPQLFPRPIDLNSSRQQNIMTPSSTSESIMIPSFPPSIYSSSIPLFGHRYLSALNNAAAAATFGSHHANMNSFLRNGAGNISQLFAGHPASSPTFHPGVLEKTLLKERAECSPSTHPMDELSTQVLSHVRNISIDMFNVYSLLFLN